MAGIAKEILPGVPRSLRHTGTLAFAPVFSDHMILQRDAEIPVWGSAAPGEKIVVTLGPLQRNTRADDEGRWLVEFEAITNRGPLVIAAEGEHGVIEIHDVLVGEVWLCGGQSNMEFLLENEENAGLTMAGASHPTIRHLSIPPAVSNRPQKFFDARWEVCSPASCGKFSAAGYHFGTRLKESLDVPVGLITSAYGGSVAESWMRGECMTPDADLAPILRAWERIARDHRDDPEARSCIAMANLERILKEGKVPPPWGVEPKGPDHFHRPSSLYHAMIHPLHPFPLRGVLWYQGESNSLRAFQYRKLLSALIADWRRLWKNPDLWFLIVQLPNFDAPWLSRDAFARMRESQAWVAETTQHTGIVCTVDLGDAAEIHPPRKAGVGERLANAASALVYGQEAEWAGPVFRSMVAGDNDIRLFFDHASGLHARWGEVRGFSVAGADRFFVPARAEIDGDSVRIYSPRHPVAVRYSWANNPDGNLYNAAGLPAFPFRTDAWPHEEDSVHEPEAF